MRGTSLLGRDRELAVVGELLDRLPAAGGTIVLAGEPGIGRSTLLRVVAERAGSAGALVSAVTGVPGGTPYSGLRELLAPLAGALAALTGPPRAVLDAMRGEAPGGEAPGGEAAHGETAHGETARGRAAGPPQPYAVGMATLHLLAAAASRRPVVLAVDDADRLDGPTAEVLGFVGRRLGHDAVVLIEAVRPPGTRAAPRLGLPVLELSPLDDEAARVLVRRHAPGATVTARECILRTARGNPLALTELPRAWRDGGPSDSWTPPRVTGRLADAFAGGLAALPRDARDTLLVAAADQVGDLPEILAAAAVLAGHAVAVDVLDAAADLVGLEGIGLRFSHPVVRSAVLRAETRDRLRAAHAALAQVLRGEPYRRAWHLAHATAAPAGPSVGPSVGPSAGEPAGEPADVLADVGSVASRRCGVALLVQGLELSARLTGDQEARGRRLLHAARYAQELGQPHVVRDLLDAAERAGLPAGERIRLEWLRDVSEEDTSPDPARVARLCATAERVAAGDPGLALDLLLGAAQRVQRTAPGPIAQRLVAGTADALGRAIPGGRADARCLAALALAEPVLRNREVAERLPATAAVADLPDEDGLRLLGLAAHAVGDPVRAVALLGRAEAGLRAQGRPGPLAEVLVLRAVNLSLLGDWNAVTRATEQARRVLSETCRPTWADTLTAAEAVAAGLRGETERALKLALRADGSRRSDLVAGVRLARGLGWLAAKRHERAYEELLPLLDKPARELGRASFAAVMPFFAAAVAGERVGRARAVLATLEEVARLAPAPLLHVQLPYARAVVADDAAAESLFLDALGHDLARWPLIRVGVEVAYAARLRRERRGAEAAALLDRARVTLGLLGAPFWADAEGAGGDRRADPAAMLSPRELEIARLAAAGLSNRQIGAELHLSPRTVSTYLSRTFPKLGVTSRAELPDLLVNRTSTQ
ncbi:LuxR C-terminal-related transcriptional regulator [Nonomuraea sp. NPDC050783]|uniref:helix-turn-helix transcriptional regulator n=1 Tax=Nonomuraea sp. NPDC050783 TaxID=3154634 RepID=UPI0034676A6F